MLKYIAGEPEVDLVLIISNKDDIAAVARVIHQDTEPRAGESTRLILYSQVWFERALNAKTWLSHILKSSMNTVLFVNATIGLF